jgi:N-acetyl-alpha-D-muramate 1-phosphate uridylyltransferase
VRALILAAGRGERMRPLSDHTPKPLLKLRGRPLIEWHLRALARDGVREVVINTAWLERRIVDALGDGSRWGLKLRYSLEGRDHGGALETAGGIAKALPLLVDGGSDCFWLVSADIHAPDFRFDRGRAQAFARSGDLAHLWLVPNPPYHAAGDFALDAAGRVTRDGADRRWTYANIALCRAALVAGVAAGTRAALGPLLFDAARAGRVSGEVLHGNWHNIGTPEQLAALDSGAPGAA